MAEEMKAFVNGAHVKEGDLNSLSGVKQLIREAPGCGFENDELPVFRWRLLNDNLAALCPLLSPKFLVGHHVGQLTLSHVQESGYSVTLTLNRFKKEVKENPKDKSKKLSSFSFFLCHFRHYDRERNFRSHRRHASGLAFDFYGDHQALTFDADVSDHVTLVDLRQEDQLTSGHMSPHENAAVGKIKKFRDTKDLISLNRLPVFSPRFRFHSLREMHLCVVRFWSAKMKPEMDEVGVSATLIFLKNVVDSDDVRTDFSATFTFFSAKKEVDNLVTQVVFTRTKGQNEFPVFLACYLEIEKLLNNPNDTLYYKVVLELMDVDKDFQI